MVRAVPDHGGRGESTAVAGRYAVNDSAIEFRPLFPFDPGRTYSVRVDPRMLPTPRNDSAITTEIALASVAHVPSATVARILPSAGTLPENQLRLYVEFSAPMSRQSGLEFVHLLDDRGNEVRGAFLPLDADFWNPDHTRYTLFLDPGRVKRGILPNEQMGRPLRAGRAYTLVVDSAWHDAQGLPLAASFRRSFRAGPATTAPIALAAWTLHAPRAGTRDPLVVTFPTPLDHGLLRRALGVETQRGEALRGDVSLGRDETEWRFIPASAWRAGDHRLVVLAILEDLAGNRVGRAFEVDRFEQTDSTALPERFTLPFVVR
ncbi:MAG: hypothetical protein JWM41_4154 [Gemmatimonadetes bacterium]|nr:hypothetical protein [Gemmatimonadota bacterium]